MEGLKTEDWSYFNTTFITIESPEAIAGIERKLAEYVAVQNNAKKDYKVNEYYLDPFDRHGCSGRT